MKLQRRLHLIVAVTALCLSSTTSGFSVQQQQQLSQSQRRITLNHALLQQRQPLLQVLLAEEDEDDKDASQNEEDCTSTTAIRQPLTQANGDLPPVIQQIADERLEFNMNLGKAMDTLRKDMPYLLRRLPDFSIYHSDITVIDPSGVRLTGLDNYKSALTFFQTFIKFWFAPSSRIQYRMVYDFCRSSIRVSWNIVLIPKLPLGRPLFLDGISHYKLDSASGKIIEHKLDQFVMNNTPVAPPYGIFSLLQQQDVLGQREQQGVPVGAGVGAFGSTTSQSERMLQ